jgi:hypothetical protein
MDLTFQFLSVVGSVRRQHFIDLGQLGGGAAIRTVLKKTFLETVDVALSHGQSFVPTTAGGFERRPG